MTTADKICKTCIFHQQEQISFGFVCVCDKSEHVADWTKDTDTCDEWEDIYEK